MPVAIAPTGLTGMQWANGEMLGAIAAEKFGIPSRCRALIFPLRHLLSNPTSLFRQRSQMPVQRLTSATPIISIHFLTENLRELTKLASCQANVHADANVRLQLRFGTRERR